MYNISQAWNNISDVKYGKFKMPLIHALTDWLGQNGKFQIALIFGFETRWCSWASRTKRFKQADVLNLRRQNHCQYYRCPRKCCVGLQDIKAKQFMILATCYK